MDVLMKEFVTPTELLELYPEMKKYWSSPQEIGQLCSLVPTIKSHHANRGRLINRKSFFSFYTYIKLRLSK